MGRKFSLFSVEVMETPVPGGCLAFYNINNLTLNCCALFG